MKFEMDIGYLENEKVTIETWDYEKIAEIHKFIQFMEQHAWCVDYEAVDPLDFEDEETEEEEMTPVGLTSDEEI
jgi:hypothetical protein